MMKAEIAEKASFEQIRYAQCWEDADVLLQALDVKSDGSYLSIASAGDNTLALVGAGAKRVIAVDLSPAQIACLELRVAAYRCLSHIELLELLGQAPSRQRRVLYQRCRSSLSVEASAFWDRNTAQIDNGVGQGGKFERYLRAFRRFVLPLVHGRKKIKRLFELETEAERRQFYDEHWNTRRWDWMCRLFFGRESLGRLGRDPSFLRFADEPVWNCLQRRIPNALVVQRPADNPYLQWILLGRFDSALPYSLRAENFERIRDNLDSLEWRCQSIEEVLDELPPASLAGYNLSDIFEYMSESAYEKLLQRLVRSGAPGCRLVYWNLVVSRKRPARLAGTLLEKRQLASNLHQQDKAFFYRDFVVEEVC
jgi:S-adenosylmethionine-diacylglycerol 3-amino-3-carboxypropyl transferase